MITTPATSNFNPPLVEYSSDPSSPDYFHFLQACPSGKIIRLYFCAGENIRKFIGSSPEISFDLETTQGANGAILPKLTVAFCSVIDAPLMLEASLVSFERDPDFKRLLKFIAKSHFLFGRIILINGDETSTIAFITEQDETFYEKLQDHMAYRKQVKKSLP